MYGLDSKHICFVFKTYMFCNRIIYVLKTAFIAYKLEADI